MLCVKSSVKTDHPCLHAHISSQTSIRHHSVNREYFCGLEQREINICNLRFISSVLYCPDSLGCCCAVSAHVFPPCHHCGEPTATGLQTQYPWLTRTVNSCTNPIRVPDAQLLKAGHVADANTKTTCHLLMAAPEEHSATIRHRRPCCWWARSLVVSILSMFSNFSSF